MRRCLLVRSAQSPAVIHNKWRRLSTWPEKSTKFLYRQGARNRHNVVFMLSTIHQLGAVQAEWENARLRIIEDPKTSALIITKPEIVASKLEEDMSLLLNLQGNKLALSVAGNSPSSRTNPLCRVFSAARCRLAPTAEHRGICAWPLVTGSKYLVRALFHIFGLETSVTM